MNKKKYQHIVGLFVLLQLFVIAISAAQNRPVPQDGVSPPIVDTVKVEQYNIEYLIAEAMHFYAIENNAMALKSFLKAHELQPENAAVNHKIAAIYLTDENLEKALFYANLAVEEDSENYFYYQTLSEIYTQKGNLPEAITALEKMFEISSPPDEYLLELAALYLYNNQPDNALETYNRIERRLGVLEEVSTQKQKILLRQNKLKEAIEEGKKLAEAKPNESEHAISVAQIMISNGKNDEAVNYLENYLEENPNQPKAHLKLAELYIQKSMLEESEQHFLQAFSSEQISLTEKINNFVPMLQQQNNRQYGTLVPKLADALLAVHSGEFKALAVVGDMYFHQQKTDSALYYYNEAIKIEGSNFQVWQNILSLQLKNQSYQKAVESAEEALTYFPNQPVLYLFAGNAHYALQQYDEAIFMLEQGKNIVFGNNQLLSTFTGQMANAYHAKKDYQQAFQLYEESIEYNPQNYYAVNNYAYYSAVQDKNLDRVESLAKKLIEDNPGNATFLDTYGWVLFKNEKYEKAVSVLNEAVNKNASATILEHYGDALFKIGEKQKALEYWNKALEKGADSDLLKKKINEKRLYEK